MVLHNPGNWHWVSKNLQAWAKQWFGENLMVSSDRDGVQVSVVRVADQQGDVDVSQRKGKVICLFDVALTLDVVGRKKDAEGEEEEVKGTINIPEVAHDTEQDEYVFDVSLDESAFTATVKDIIRKNIQPILRERLSTFGDTLREKHAQSIQHTAENDPKTLASTPASSQTSPPATSNSAKRTAEPKEEGRRAVNSTSFNETYEFTTSADQLYLVFVDPPRVAAWARSKPDPYNAKVDGEFALFGGNVTGKFLQLEPSTLIRQTWRAKDWPPGQYATLSLEFAQGSDGTKLKTQWQGVPLDMEEVVRRNFVEYYVTPIKTTFGFGTVL